MELLKLPVEEQKKFYKEIRDRIGLSEVAIEKDLWVTAVLRALFALPYSEQLSFKGGTSLSKCWNLIERFSEDIDIAVNRELLGFTGTLSKTQINDKLRRASCAFVREKLQFDLQKQLKINGISNSNFAVNVNITPITTTDPEIIEIQYKTLFIDKYIKPVVKLEISGRSMNEPVTEISLQSFLDEILPDTPYSEKPFLTNAVVPERTFWEKICLLHEEFAKPQELIRSERMSRHLYDLEKMISSPIANKALKDRELYNSIVEHRKFFVGLKGFDYSTLATNTINILPPESVISEWRQDYETMRDTMIYGESLSFDKLMEKIKQLNETINRLEWE